MRIIPVLLFVIGATMRRNPVYSHGIITFTSLARARRRSPSQLLHQIGEIHPIGHAQKQAPSTHYDFRISAPKVRPPHGDRPNSAGVRFQQKPLAVAIVSLTHAAQLTLEQRVKRVRDPHKLLICGGRGCTSN
jgi:hypothetical protein